MISEDQVLKLFFICKANISEFSRKKSTLKSKSAICEIFEQKIKWDIFGDFQTLCFSGKNTAADL